MLDKVMIKINNVVTRYIAIALIIMGNMATANEFEHQHSDEASIVIEHAWSRSLPPVVPNGAAYLSIINNGQPDTLVKVSSSIAANSMVHESYIEDDKISMRHVGKVDIAQGQHVEFKPGGYHIMLMGLKKPLSLGTQFTLTLTFEHAGEIEVKVPVIKDKATIKMHH